MPYYIVIATMFTTHNNDPLNEILDTLTLSIIAPRSLDNYDASIQYI